MSYTFAKANAIFKLAEKQKKSVEKWSIDENGSLYCINQDECDKHYEMTVNSELKKLEKTLDIYDKISNMINERKAPPTQYMITVRPNDKQCTFKEFYDKVMSFVSRKCFIEYTLSFEQKGENLHELGHGFHVHIIATMRQRSFGEVLRDVKSSWNPWIKDNKLATNCIQVDKCNNGEQVIQDYLIDYKSNDEHKIKTKAMDEVWRINEKLQSIYHS